MRQNDLFVDAVLDSPKPRTWSAMRAKLPGRLGGSGLIAEEARSFGIEDVYIAPLPRHDGSVAAVILNADQAIPQDPQLMIEAHASSVYYSVAAEALIGRTATSISVRLSGRELDCLHWGAEGKSATDTGALLGISRRTVETHMANVQRKLGVRTTVQAVAKALQLGPALSVSLRRDGTNSKQLLRWSTVAQNERRLRMTAMRRSAPTPIPTCPLLRAH
jgi:DNA-binding CsgD family transcriptional regulator